MERTLVLRVLTRCATVDQFVETFRRLSTDTAVFVPTRNQRDIGVETAFSMRLVDGTIVLSGLGSIAARFETADNLFGKPGILVDIRRLTSESEPVFAQMRVPPPVPMALADEANTTRTPVATTLGVAPLAPATFATSHVASRRPERTAMGALDRDSGELRPGPWLALGARLARTVRTVRWWMRRRRSTQLET